MIGSTLFHFKVTAKLGEGGMGEVYRAEDTKLGREVAIKVLPEAVVGDPERLARFEREARVLASLNHTNISAIYEVGSERETHFLVMELVEGEDLAEHIARGPIPYDEALPIALQIAEALEAAHDRGIIHRDLKPANIKVTSDGRVKVLDFGLAKALDPSQGSWDSEAGTLLRNSSPPTLTAQMTGAGVVVGTAAYMAPEQTRGQEVDKRADIWAFGCVLFEMLTGKLAFGGPTISDSIAATLEREPSFADLPEETPQSARRLLRRCLSKDPKSRLRDIGDARIELEIGFAESEDPSAEQSATTVQPATAKSTLARWIAQGLLAGLVGAALGIAAWSQFVRSPSQASVGKASRWVLQLEPGLQVAIGGRSNPLALSPDGSRLVFAAERRGNPQLYLRDLNSFETIAIPGTAGARNPFFSPDGEWVGFFSGNRLLKVSLQGGQPRSLCETPLDDLGGSWSPAGFIVFAEYGSGLSRVSAEGGTPVRVTTLDYTIGEVQHRWPQVLPDGKSVLFTVATDKGSQVAVASLEDGIRRSVPGLVDVSRAWYVPTGRLIYGQAGGLLGAPFDLSNVEATGDPVSVLDGVASVPDLGNAFFAISDAGTVAYMPGGASGQTQLVWVDRSGNETPAIKDTGAFMHVRLSRDGQRLGVSVGSEVGPRRLMLYDLKRGTRAVLANNGSNLFWSPGGDEVVYSSNRSGSWDLYRASADGTDGGEVLLDKEHEQWVGSWSPDGKALLYYEINPEAGRDIWLLPMDGGEPSPFIATPFNERSPRFSPDGQWLAYISNESGRDEVYVEPFPGRERKWTISTDGGREPVWSPDGNNLYYRQGDQMLVVDISYAPDFSANRPQVVFEGHYEVGVAGNPDWDISPDGERFLMIKRMESSASTRLHLVLNWFDELERIVSSGG